MSIAIHSQPFAPGARGYVLAFVPRDRQVQAVNLDPSTAAAFRVDRLDVLTPGETEMLCGRMLASVRLAVSHVGASPARFRAELVVGPDLGAVQSQIAGVVERDWRRAHDEARASGQGPAAPIVSIPKASGA